MSVVTDDGSAVSGLIIGPGDMVPLVMDMGKRWKKVLTPNGFEYVEQDLYWKFPGGRLETEDLDEIDALIREVVQEIGLKFNRNQFTELARQQKPNHERVLYRARTNSFDGLKEVGDDGEIVKLFHISKFRGMENFHPGHLKLYNQWWLETA